MIRLEAGGDAQRNLQRSINQAIGIGRMNLQVGVINSGIRYDEGESIVDVAFDNEFGTENGQVIPARPFLVPGIDNFFQENNAGILRGLRKVIFRLSPLDRFLNRIGAKASARVKKEMVDLRTPANAQSTIDEKGSDNPLIDTGRLKNNISWLAQVQ